MKKAILLSVSLLLAIAGQAQHKWTLRDCVDYAIDNNIQIKQQELTVKQSEIDLNTSKMSRLPDLNSSVNQSFNFGKTPSGLTNIYEKQNTYGASLGVSSSTPIFTGFRISNQINANKFTLLAATEGLQKAKENLEVQITSMYLDVLFKKELLSVYKVQVEQSSEQVEKTQLMVEGGKVPLAQLYDIKAQLAADELKVTNGENDLDLSLLDLSQALNLEDNSSFDIMEPILGENVIEDNLSSLLPPNQIYQVAVETKPHVREAEYRLQSSKKYLGVARSGYYPTVNLNLGYDTRYNKVWSQNRNELLPNGQRIGGTSPFFSQFKNNASQYIGMTLNIPLFNRLETRNKVRSANIDVQNRDLELLDVKRVLFKEIQQAYQSAIAAQARYESTDRSYLAASESYKYAKEKYEVGKSTVFEYNEARFKLLTSQSESIQSKYDFLFRAKILDFYRGIQINIE